MSKLSRDRLLSFCRLNLSFNLFPLYSSSDSSTAVECRMMVITKTKSSWVLNTLNQAFALQLMNVQ